MSVRRTTATAWRVLAQLRRDPRTVAMVLAVPPLLMLLLRYAFDSNPLLFDRVAPILIAIFPFVLMFVITSVAMLRERTSGTLERLLAMPIAKLDLLVGYGIAFGGVAPKPWRARAAEQVLRGAHATVEMAGRAADAELAVARPLAGNAFKIPLARAALIAVMRELIKEAVQ